MFFGVDSGGRKHLESSKVLLMEEILHLGCKKLGNNGRYYLSTGAGFLPSTVPMVFPMMLGKKSLKEKGCKEVLNFHKKLSGEIQTISVYIIYMYIIKVCFFEKTSGKVQKLVPQKGDKQKQIKSETKKTTTSSKSQFFEMVLYTVYFFVRILASEGLGFV